MARATCATPIVSRSVTSSRPALSNCHRRSSTPSATICSLSWATCAESSASRAWLGAGLGLGWRVQVGVRVRFRVRVRVRVRVRGRVRVRANQGQG